MAPPHAPLWLLLILFALGTALGAALNWAIYRLAWYQRPISPWSAAPRGAAPRQWPDHFPIIGWLRLRREAKLHGRGFWIRPLLVELVTGLGLAWLANWEIWQRGLYATEGLPAQIGVPVAHLYAQFGAQVLLLCLLVVASLIDLDERLIPDSITLTGTLAGLALAAALPW